jgi:hypothetical protein
MGGVIRFAGASGGLRMPLALETLNELACVCDVIATSLFFLRQNNFSFLSFLSLSGPDGYL